MNFRSLFIIIVLSFIASQAFPQRLIPYRKGSLWGYADSNGLIKIKPQYDYAGTDDCGLMSVTSGIRTGIIDRNGAVVIPLEYRSAGANCGDRNGGCIIARDGEGYKLFSHDGKKVLATGITWVVSHAGPNIEVQVDQKHGLLNINGKWLLEPDQQWIEVCDGGYYIIKKEEETYYYNPSGKRIFKKNLLLHGKFENGYARIYYLLKKKDKLRCPTGRELTPEEKNYFQQVNIINHKGKLLVPEGYSTNSAGPRGGWMIVRGPKGTGIIDSTGKFVVPAVYDDIDGSWGFITLKKNNLFGAVTPGSWQVINPVYNAVEKFNGMLYVTRSGNFHKLIDMHGKQLYDDFNWIGSEDKVGFTAGRNDKIFWMDEKGKIILEMDTLNYQSAYPFDGELSIVHSHGKAGLINRQGKQVAPFAYSAFYKEGKELYRVHGSGLVNTYHNSGVMRQDGKLVLDTIHQMVHMSRDQKHILVQDNDLWGLYDLNGKELLPENYIQVYEAPTGVYILQKPNPAYKPEAVAVNENGEAMQEGSKPLVPPILFYVADKEGKILGKLTEFPGIQNTFTFLQDANGWIRFDGKKFWED